MRYTFEKRGPGVHGTHALVNYKKTGNTVATCYHTEQITAEQQAKEIASALNLKEDLKEAVLKKAKKKELVYLIETTLCDDDLPF